MKIFSNKAITRTLNNEPLLFSIIVIVYTLPIFIFRLFVTVDGASHLYNARLMHILLFDKGSIIHEYFSLNTFLMPNLLGHFLLLLFQEIVPAYWAEKLVQLTYIITFPVSFRMFCRTLYPEKKWLPYFIFPLIYSFVFYLGFYNFCLSISLYFFTLSFWLQRSGKNIFKETTILISLLLLAYLAHMFTFSILLLSIAVFILVDCIYQLKNKNLIVVSGIFLRQTTQLIIGALPAFILAFFYIQKFGKNSEVIFLTLRETWNCLATGRALITFNSILEAPFTTSLMIILGLFVIVAVWELLKGKKGEPGRPGISKDRNNSRPVIVLFVIFLVAYWFMPDAMASGEFVSIRLLLFVMIFAIAGPGAIVYHRKYLRYSSLILFFMISARMAQMHLPAINKYSKEAWTYYSAGRFLKDESLVLPLNNSTDWYIGHFCNYSGVENNVVILSNYEAARGNFPVVWDTLHNPDFWLGNMSNPDPCIRPEEYEFRVKRHIDYIAFWAEHPKPDVPCSENLQKFIRENYSLSFALDNLKIYNHKMHRPVLHTWNEDFENNPRGSSSEIAHSGKYSFKMGMKFEFSPGLYISAAALALKKGMEVDISCQVYSLGDLRNIKLVAKIDRDGKNIFYSEVLPDSTMLPGRWNQLSLVFTPLDILPDDRIQVYAWQQTGPPVFVDDLLVTIK